MPREEKSNQFIAIRSMFLSGNVKKMKDIGELYPTLVAKTLKMNHSRYVQKLYKPQEFSIKQVIALATILDIQPQTILDVILKEVNPSSKFGKRSAG